MSESFTLENEQCPKEPSACSERLDTPNDDTALVAACEDGPSFIESFGKLVDEMRQLNTDFGLRPYRLFSVVTRWTGGQIGRGEQVVVSEQEFLPTPFVSVAPLYGEMTSAGLIERGEMRVTEISPRYTEEDIYALFSIQPLPEGYESFIEMRSGYSQGSNARRRRFYVIGIPERQAEKFQWRARMVEQNAARSRQGVLSSNHGVIP